MADVGTSVVAAVAVRQYSVRFALLLTLFGSAIVGTERWTSVAAQGCSFTVLPLTVTVPGAGGSGQVTVTTSPGCAWTAFSVTAWLSVTPASGVGSGSVTWSAPANPLSSQRIGYLTVAGRSIFFGQTQTTASTTPSNLSAQTSGSTLTLSWTAPGLTGVTGYIVEVGSAPGLANLASIPTGSTATTFVAPNVPPGTYYLRVRASAGGIPSAPSNEVTATIVGSTIAAPGAPGQLAATVSGNSVTLTWSAPASGGPPTTYVMAVGSASGWSNLASFATGSGTSFSANGVPNGTYFARVSAQNATGTSAASNEVSFSVPQACGAPPAPTSLQSSVSGRSLTLSWSAPVGNAPMSYVIEAGSAASLADLATVNTGSTATTFTANAPPGTFFLRVRAVNACGVSAATDDVAVLVPY